MGCHLFEGISAATMSHNEAWHFSRLARSLERADKTTRILDVKYLRAAAVGERRGHAVRRYPVGGGAEIGERIRNVPQAPRPHSARHGSSISCCWTANSRAPCGIRSGAPTHRCTPSRARPWARSRAPRSSGSGSCARSWISPTSTPSCWTGLHEFLDGLQAKMNTIGECVLGDFFVHAPAMGAAS